MPKAAEIIAGLDIGSANIRLAVGELSGEDEKVNVIGLAEGPSAGVSRGSIRSIEEVVAAIAAVVEKAERMTGLSLDRVYLAVSGGHIASQLSRGVIAVSGASGEIREDDVNRVLEAAQAVSVPPNYEILHVLPRSFTIDSQSGVKDPLGMNGVRLEVEAQIIEGQTGHIKNLTKAATMAGLGIDDLVLSALAGGLSALTERQKDLGVALVTVGAATTSVLAFEEGDILHAAVLPVGSAHITNDIAIGLRTNIDVAEEIKMQYGQAVLSSSPAGASRNDEVDMRAVAETEEGVFSKKHLAEIIEARVEEIFRLVDKELRLVNRSGKLPCGIVLAGGGAKLPGMAAVAKREFRLPASVGLPIGVNSAIDRLRDPALCSVVGLLLWGQDNLLAGRGGFDRVTRGVLQNLSHGIKSLLRLFKP